MRNCLIISFLAALVSAIPAVPSAQSRAMRAPGHTITYYVAADEVDWDYAPSGIDKVREGPFTGVAADGLIASDGRIGRVYRKAIYREYSDASFQKLKPRTSAWEHLGILGPVLRAQVGDTIKVVFRNNGSNPYSVHPHGVFYNKDSEGAGSSDGTSGGDKADDAVMPGKQHTYTWPVPERAGPAMGDPSSILWMYHSHVNEAGDVNEDLLVP